MKEHCKQIAQRLVNAEIELIDVIQYWGKITREQATEVAKAYKKHKLVKLDTYHGKYEVKHGSFLSAEVIANAVHNLGLQLTGAPNHDPHRL